jgi:hypothetical protein
MIFAIWGLTVLGTGTERAGTSSTGTVWVLPADGPSSPNIPHKNAAARDFHITAARISFAGAPIAFPQFNFLCFRRALRAPLQPRCPAIIPSSRRKPSFDIHSERFYSALMPASWITLKRALPKTPRTMLQARTEATLALSLVQTSCACGYGLI